MKPSPSGDCYHFSYRWSIDGPIDTVFSFIADASTFHDWFFVFKEVHLDEPNQEVRLGSHTRCVVKAFLPYVLDWDFTVSALDRPHLVETACRVTLSGRFPLTGYVRYRLVEENGRTVVINEQELCSEQHFPGALRWLAQKAFTFNHDWAMGRAEKPLQRVVSQAVNLHSSGA
jgi:uncharacterized protein YndB with AHSA1/START domain